MIGEVAGEQQPVRLPVHRLDELAEPAVLVRAGSGGQPTAASRNVALGPPSRRPLPPPSRSASSQRAAVLVAELVEVVPVLAPAR